MMDPFLSCCRVSTGGYNFSYPVFVGELVVKGHTYSNHIFLLSKQCKLFLGHNLAHGKAMTLSTTTANSAASHGSKKKKNERKRIGS